MTIYSWKKSGFFFHKWRSQTFPNFDFLNFRWIFFPKMTLAQFPVFGFFFQDSRIGVNNDFCQKEERVTKYCDSNCNQALVSSPHHILHLHLYSVIRCSSIWKPMSDNSAENCQYDKWSPYSECSVTCGQGKKFSQRFLKKYSVRFQIHSEF